jgi:hypothetical protein
VFEVSNVSHANGIGGSQVGSQSGPAPSHVQPWSDIVIAAQWHVRRHRPTSGDCLVLLWEQEAAGSNPAIPTKAQVVGLSRPDVVARAIRRAREILR